MVRYKDRRNANVGGCVGVRITLVRVVELGEKGVVQQGELAMVAVNYLWNPINDNIVREFDDAGATIAGYTTEPDLHGL